MDRTVLSLRSRRSSRPAPFEGFASPLPHLRWKGFAVSLFLLLLVLFAPVPAARAAGTFDIACGDSATLVTYLNLTAGFGQLGPWTFNLAANCTYTLPQTLVIVDQVTINANGSTLTPDSPRRLIELGSHVFMPGVTRYGQLVLNDAIIQNGSASDSGGAINIPDSNQSATISRSIFSNNSAVMGGAISSAGTLQVSYSTFSNNEASHRGGAIISLGAMIVNGTTFSGNSAYYGGGVDVELNTNMITNSTFTGNSATDHGGAIENNTGSPDLYVVNCTLSGNIGNIDGGGINSHETNVHLANSILANNTGGNWGGTAPAAAINNLRWPVSDTTLTATAGNPLLSALGAWGAPAGYPQTMALLPGSAAIAAGSASLCATAVASGGAGGMDARGVPRPSPAGSTCDIGAFESRGFTWGSTSGGGQHVSIHTAFANPLAAHISATNSSEPVQGGVVTFNAPDGSLASTTFAPTTTATINSSGNFSVPVTANGYAGGPYYVSALANGLTTINYALTNDKGATTTVLNSSLNPSRFGNSVTFTATVSQIVSGTPSPTGTVEFTADDADIAGCGSVTLSGSTATCTTSALTRGLHTIEATYSGDANYSSSTKTLSQTVNDPPAITSANNTTFTAGQAGSFTVTTTGYPAPSLSMTPVAPTAGLPSGVTINAGTGALSGTPGAGTGGVYTFTITAANGISPNATQTFTLTVDEAPAFTSANSTGFMTNQAGSFTITTHGYPRPSISLTVGSLPSGVNLTDNGNGTATLSGTPNAGSSGPYSLTFAAQNSLATATQNFTLSVGQPPSITSDNHATFRAGAADSFTIAATGYPAPLLTLAPVAPTTALPAGLTFQDNGNGTARLSGTAAAGTGGTYTYTITAHNTSGANATQTFTLMVEQTPAFTSANTTTFAVGQAGTFTVLATGYPTPTVGQFGTLPAGVTFNTATRALSGTPASGTGGVYTLTLIASNGVGPDAYQTFTLVVGQSPSITSANVASFRVGEAGSFTFTTLGNPTPSLTFAPVAPTAGLPTGLTFQDNGNGTARLSGTPAAGTGGTSTFSIIAANGITPNAVQSFTLIIQQAPAITSANSATFTAGQAGTFSVSASGYPAPAVALFGTLPAGVTYNSTTRVLSGTPASGTGGVYPVTLIAANGVEPYAMQPFTLTVNEAPVISSANSTAFIVGQQGSFVVAASGWPAPSLAQTGTLPGGVSFSPASGLLSGIPDAGAGGVYSLSFTATSTSGQANQSFMLTVTQQPAITSVNAATFTVGSPGSFQVTATGYPAPTLSEGGTLPAGLTFNPTTGLLGGTPAAATAGTYTISFTAHNGIVQDAIQTFTVKVESAASQAILTSSANPSVHLQTVTFTARVTGGDGTPAGTVAFQQDWVNIAGCVNRTLIGQADGSALATCTRQLAIGQYELVAVYSGDANHGGITSPVYTQSVNKADTTTTVTSSTNPSMYGDAVTFTATVSAASPGGGAPSGAVTFEADGTLIANCSNLLLTGQQANCTASRLSGPGQNISAEYAGDDNFNSSTGALAQEVNKATLTVTADDKEKFLGAPLPSFTASYSGFVFKEDSTALTGEPAFSTTATAASPAGAYPITPLQGTLSSNNYQFTFVDGTLKIKIPESATAITSHTPDPSEIGQDVAVAFSVTGNDILGSPTGSVTISDGTETCSGDLSAGSGFASLGSCTLNLKTLGEHALTASYGGDANYVASVSPAVSHTVIQATTTTELVSSTNPSLLGQSVTFTAKVHSEHGVAEPGGAVTFYEVMAGNAKGERREAGTLALGKDASFTWTTSDLSMGDHQLVAEYSGDANFAGSTSPVLTQTVIETALDNDLLEIQWDGWVGARNPAASGGAYRVSQKAGDRITYQFTGTAITWFTHTGPDQGFAEVLIDGVRKARVDLYGEDKWAVAKSYSGLASRKHTLVIRVLGTKRAASTAANVVMDGLNVGGAMIEESALEIKYTNWLGIPASEATGRNYRASVKRTSRATLAFTGTSIRWVTRKCATCGKADVYIDGVKKGTFDLYAPGASWGYEVVFDGLSDRVHAIEIRVLGTKNPSSRGVSVAIDGFRGSFLPR